MNNKIMLLEDDVSLIDGLQYSLKKNGFDIDFVRSVIHVRVRPIGYDSSRKAGNDYEYS